VRYEIRPLGHHTWTDPVTRDRRSSRAFRAPWSATLDRLRYETGRLDATLVVIQVDVIEGDIRRDGMLRAGARVGFPGVRISFDSRYGPLTYATDAYDTWRANVRAIAIALEALRAVDRYGVTRRGEQYTGWSQIQATPARPTREQAAVFLAEHTDDRYTPSMALADPDAALRDAAKRHHPDRGGDHDTFARLTEARDIIRRRGAP
jgi:hypothetical protein